MQEFSTIQLCAEEVTTWRLCHLLSCIEIKVLYKKIKPVQCCFKNIGSLILKTISLLDKYNLETFVAITVLQMKRLGCPGTLTHMQFQSPGRELAPLADIYLRSLFGLSATCIDSTVQIGIWAPNIPVPGVVPYTSREAWSGLAWRWVVSAWVCQKP